MSLDPQFRLSSSWSRAGVGTCVVIDLNETGKQRIAFDIGSTPIFDHAITASFVFISHGHLDHIGGIFSHARAHMLTYSKAPTYYVPKPLVSKLEMARDAMSELDSAIMDDTKNNKIRKDSLKSMNIIGVEPGNEYLFQPNKCGTMFVRTFSVDHEGHPSIGYIIGRRISGGLLAKFKDLPSREIGALVKSGIQVKASPQEILEVSYTGDTSALGLLLQEESNNTQEMYRTQIFQAHLIFCELTFLESGDERSKLLATKSGHLHIDDIPEILSSHGWDLSDLSEMNRSSRIVFYHLSQRYRPAHRALRLLMGGLPRALWENVDISVSSLLLNSQDEHEKIVCTCLKQNGCVSLIDFVSVSSLGRDGFT